MVAICPRKYQRPRHRGYSGMRGCGRPGCLAPKQLLQYTSIYSILSIADSSTAAQHREQYTSASTLHTPSGGRRIYQAMDAQ